MLKSALHYSHELAKEVIQQGDTVIDGTVGNGYDTLLLAELVGIKGTVYGFDIQKQALATTENKLREAGLMEQTHLYHQGHETLDAILKENEKIKAAIFNLGYLPQSDKKIITRGETTVKALETLLPHLEKTGRILIVIYYGHDGGAEEKNQVLDFVEKLPQKEYDVLSYQFINQKNDPPVLIVIERKNKKRSASIK